MNELRWIFTLCIALLSQAAASQDVQRMDQVVQELVDMKEFMGTVLVARGDEIIFSKAYGEANVEWHVPNVVSGKFRIGSITKQFTAVSILLLEERGRLSIDDPIAKHMPDAPAAWKAITLKHLLTHTSGIANFTNAPDYETRKFLPTSVGDLIAVFRDKPLEFEPGAKMSYSNSGYVLLGYVIGKASGVSYEEFVRKNIFEALGMKDSVYDSNLSIVERRAAGYVRNAASLWNAEYLDMTVPYAAGGLLSTTEDLWRWQRALYSHRLLSEASVKKLTTPFKGDYAFGVAVGSLGKYRSIRHGGAIDGFNTELAWFPESQTTVVALANMNTGAPVTIVDRLAKLAHGEKVELIADRREISLAPEVLQKFVGTYALEPMMDMMVTVEGGSLMVQSSGQAKVTVYARTPTSFFLKAADAQIDFVLEGDKVTHLILHQNGRDAKAPRTSNTVAVRKEITLAEEKLKEYVGTYAVRPGFDLNIRMDQGAMIGQATGQDAVPLFAEAPDKFFAKVVDLQVEFKRTEGAVSALVLNQGAYTFTAPRK